MKRSRPESNIAIKPQNFTLQIHTSEYSKLYSHYLKNEYHQVQQMIKMFVKRPYCKEYYLKYPLQGLIRGVCKKLLMNANQFIVYGYFLSQVEWKLDHNIYNSLAEVFPNIMHVNQATNPDVLKQLSMFLYFSSYSIKEFLNQDVRLIKQEMLKLFPEFQHLQAYWTSTQQTVGQMLNPKVLNGFFKEMSKVDKLVDFNSCIDKILQISPCYDITNKNQKQKQVPIFGFMENGGFSYIQEVEIQNFQFKIDGNLQDYDFNGEI